MIVTVRPRDIGPVRALAMADLSLTIGNSKPVTSDQDGVHPKLIETVERHRNTTYQRPVADHTKRAFDQLADEITLNNSPLILDAGCGTGMSTEQLATQYPDFWVIGVDKSDHRLSKPDTSLPDNARLIRADLVDFYRLSVEAGWRFDRQFHLYPNPWPKLAQLSRRWHGHPIFPTIIDAGGELELRTNWPLYAKEFATALNAYGINSDVRPFAGQEPYLTLFERKYTLSGQMLYQLTATLPHKPMDSSDQTA